MPLFQRILVPVDFTERTQPSLDYALGLASDGARVDVLHVWEPPKHVSPNVRIQMPGETRESLRSYVEGQATQQMARLIASLQAPPGVLFNPLIECGRITSTILEVAERVGSDLLIVATAGRSGLSRFFVGSVAENLVRHSPCPVLTIRVAAKVSEDESGE